jgi:hypothetical protein
VVDKIKILIKGRCSMGIVRQIIDSSLLADKINLPESLKNKKVEITILPFNEINMEMAEHSEIKTHTIEDLIGIANKDGKHKLTPELRKKEKEAWAEAMVDKHGYKHSIKS